MRGRLRRHAWTCPHLQRIDACRRPPESLPGADVAATAVQAAAADAAEPASNTPPAAALPAEAAPQTLMEAAARLLTVLGTAVAERCLMADEPATSRRAAELQAACDPGSPLWPKFCDGSSEAPATSFSQIDPGKQCGRSGSAAETSADNLHQPSAVVRGQEITSRQDDWTANADVQHRQAKSVAAAICGITAPAQVLVLFSGGVDSTLLAALAHQVHPLAKVQSIRYMCHHRLLCCRLHLILHSIGCSLQWHD